MTVYVVFPFGASAVESLDARLTLSQSLRDTISGIVGRLGHDVKVEPATLAKTEELEQWREPGTVIDRLRGAGLQPDILLLNSGSLKDDPDSAGSQYIVLLLRPSVPDATGRFEEKVWIREIGRKREISYLAIRATLTLVEQIKTYPNRSVPADQESEIARNALREYLALLETDNREHEAYAAATTLLTAKTVTIADALKIVRKYPPDRASRVQEIQKKHDTAHVRKLPGPGPEPVVVPDPPAASAPAPATAPQPQTGVGT